MKTIKIFAAVSIVAILLMLLPSSCAKTSSAVTYTAADSATQIIIAGDELNVSYEVDQAVNEALLATSISIIASGNTTGVGTSGGEYNTITKVIIDTSRIVDSSLIWVTYYGNTADGIKGKSGSVILHFAKDNSGKIIPWTTPGASISITFDQYEVVVNLSQKSLILNGTINLTNVSGGLLTTPAYVNLPVGDSLHDKVNGPITFTYNDQAGVIVYWTWNINQARSFYVQNSLLTLAVSGDTTINGKVNISTSGLNRFNDNFYTGTISPVVQTISSAYVLSNPQSGQKTIYAIPEPIQLYYGVNSNGNAMTSGTPYGYKLTWTSNGTSAQAVEAYQTQ